MESNCAGHLISFKFLIIHSTSLIQSKNGWKYSDFIEANFSLKILMYPTVSQNNLCLSLVSELVKNEDGKSVFLQSN